MLVIIVERIEKFPRMRIIPTKWLQSRASIQLQYGSCCVHNDTSMPCFNYYYLVHLQMHFIALIVIGEFGEGKWGFSFVVISLTSVVASNV